MDHDVAIMGGGPAACAATVLLARDGRDVALVRPSTPPASALAQSIPPSAGRVLVELDLLPALEGAGFHPNGGNTVWWAGAQTREERFDEGRSGVHVDRAGLEAVLVVLAREAGAHVYDGSVRDASEAEAGWRLRCRLDGGAEVELGAPWLIDATGRRGVVARHEGRVDDRRTATVAIVRRWRNPSGFPGVDATHTLVESYRDGWAWSVPLAPDVRCVAVMVDRRYTELSGRSLDDTLGAELGKAARLAACLEGAEPMGAAWACPASLYTSERFARHGLLLAGDAGSFIDPLSSFGVKKALSSGWLAAIAVNTALAEPSMVDTAVTFFDRREREVYVGYRARSVDHLAACADAYEHPYWIERASAAQAAADDAIPAGAGAWAGPPQAEPDVLRSHGVSPASAREALERIRARPTLDARLGHGVHTVQRPTVAGYRIALADHLASERAPHGLRWIRNVDLARLVEVAPRHDAVPDGWDAYNAGAPAVSLPDYLAALATAFAAGLLEHVEK